MIETIHGLTGPLPGGGYDADISVAGHGRISYGFIPGCGDAAPVHVALQAAWDAGQCAGLIVAPLQPPVTAARVKGERDRRTYAPLLFEGHSYDGDADSAARIARMASLAVEKSHLDAATTDWMVTGVPSVWTDAAGADVPVLMDDMIGLRQAWIDREQRLRARCSAIIAMAPIPADYTVDSHWA